MNTGAIIVIEDDEDDKDILLDVMKELNVTNPLIWFKNSFDAMNYLQSMTEQPFFILCDINLPKQNGIEFKKTIDQDKQLRKKSIPFIFYSTAANQKLIEEAYTEMAVQGFFQKSTSFEEIKRTVRLIMDYWSACKHPNSR